jgi:hypothetical protein
MTSRTAFSTIIVLGMLLENLGIDRAVEFSRVDDWRAAIENLAQQQGSTKQS